MAKNFYKELDDRSAAEELRRRATSTQSHAKDPRTDEDIEACTSGLQECGVSPEVAITPGTTDPIEQRRINIPNAPTCTRRLQFCAGHRVPGHEGKCCHLHGHNYVVFLTAMRVHGYNTPDNQGRVVDFGVLKSVVGKWIAINWDHAFIIGIDDTPAKNALKTFQMFEREACDRNANYHARVFHLPLSPTAENMAEYLLRNFDDKLSKHRVALIKVKLWETENCYAIARR